jgi:eukaryotic-like serine/threonine-protein kinase
VPERNESPQPRIGEILADRYRVLSVIGQGGMGIVLEAEDVRTGRAVAVKALAPGADSSDELRRRFEREAHAAGFLAHPNIVEVYELGIARGGLPFIAMELVRGAAVAELIAAGPLHPRRALVILRQALLGAGYAHQHGLVHRDLKPENLMVTAVGEGAGAYELVKVLDFGLVKLSPDAAIFDPDRLTRTGVAMGTPAYMAPEQALGRPLDARADLYALGVILFEMLTGAPPFASADPMALLRMQVGHPAPTLASRASGAPWCTPAMEALIARALAKSPSERYPSAAEMIAAVAAAFGSIDHVPNDAQRR